MHSSPPPPPACVSRRALYTAARAHTSAKMPHSQLPSHHSPKTYAPRGQHSARTHLSLRHALTLNHSRSLQIRHIVLDDGEADVGLEFDADDGGRHDVRS
mmetsp:Transcript_51097/g.132692  ORF Transcript_51097/g.132692 Transcript_51097/m.132692 type:complete len:100 (+) Transcript_51097:1383-1682(+)